MKESKGFFGTVLEINHTIIKPIFIPEIRVKLRLNQGEIRFELKLNQD